MSDRLLMAPAKESSSREYLRVEELEGGDSAAVAADASPGLRRFAPWALGTLFLLTGAMLCTAGYMLMGRHGALLPKTAEADAGRGGPVLLNEDTEGCPDAPLHDFYMYRAQTDEDYNPVNQDMANIGGCLWYLHNEIIWHHYLRVGSFSSIPKTRIERFRVKTRSTCALHKKGMNFGVVNAYDLGKCTGPFKCENLEHYGPVVGCEAWNKGEDNHFPHKQWYGDVKYPNAMWYSLPGACSSEKFWGKTKECRKEEPSGACRKGIDVPTGARDCTYTYEKVGEISIDDLEGIPSFGALMKKGGYEYSRSKDKGKKMHFWDDKESPTANQRRINRVLDKFHEKYPDQPVLEDPPCDFNLHGFYPNWPHGTFD